MTHWLIWRTFWGNTISGLALGSIYALFALGYTLVYGVLRLINFAHSEIFMLGTFGALIGATKVLDIPIVTSANGYPYKSGIALIGTLVFVLIVAMVFTGAGAVVLERSAYRPLRGAGDWVGATVLALATGLVVGLAFLAVTKIGADDSASRPSTKWAIVIALVLCAPIAYGYKALFGRGRSAPRLAFLISAIGASTAISEAVAIWGPKQRNQYQTPRVLEKKVLFHFFDAEVRVDYVIVLLGALLMMVALVAFVGRTRLGRGVRAVAQDAESARLMGVNIDAVIMVTFLIGGIMAGGAAMLFTLVYDQTRNNIGFLLGVKSFTAAVLGGIGNLKGALLGGLLLGLAENWGATIFGGQWKDVIAFVVLLVVLMVRPTGLLGEALGRARA